MRDEWYFQKQGHILGPYTESQLQRLVALGEVSPETPLQHDGTLLLAGEVRGLFPNVASSLRSAIVPELAPKAGEAPFAGAVGSEAISSSTALRDGANTQLDAAPPAWLIARRSLALPPAAPESPPETAGLDFDTWPPPALTPIDALLSDLSGAPPHSSLEERLVPAPPKGALLTRYEFPVPPPLPIPFPAASATADPGNDQKAGVEKGAWRWSGMAPLPSSSIRQLIVATVALLLLIPSVAWLRGRTTYPDNRVAKLTVNELVSRVTDRSFTREDFFRKFGGPKRALAAETSLIFTFTCRDGDAEVVIASEPFQANGEVHVRSCKKSPS